jgi:hypothetical protein
MRSAAHGRKLGTTGAQSFGVSFERTARLCRATTRRGVRLGWLFRFGRRKTLDRVLVLVTGRDGIAAGVNTPPADVRPVAESTDVVIEP